MFTRWYNLRMVYPVMYYANPVSNLLNYFKAKGALEQDKAIAMTDLDWVEAGLLFNPAKTILKPYSEFLKMNSDGKFWLYSDGIFTYMNKQNKLFWVTLTVVFGLMFIVGLLTAIFS